MPLVAPPNLTSIRLSSTVDVNYWCQTLQCSETQLRNAVHTVGPLVEDVRAYLRR